MGYRSSHRPASGAFFVSCIIIPCSKLFVQTWPKATLFIAQRRNFIPMDSHARIQQTMCMTDLIDLVDWQA